MPKIKISTHIIAAGFIGLAGFLASGAGTALIHQYPLLAPAAIAVGAIATYINPKTS